MSYTNDLHEALLTKDGPTFWKCWRSKFQTRASPTQVGGCVDPTAIANNFASYFSEVYAASDQTTGIAPLLYIMRISHYVKTILWSSVLAAELAFDTELVSKITLELKPGKLLYETGKNVALWPHC